MTLRTENKSEYYAWVNMRQRCYNPSHPEYERYGAIGREVCDEWKNSFKNFLEDMGKKPSKELSLERVDNSLGYFKSNCKWDTKGRQSFNQKLAKDNSSGVVGVYLERQTSRWKAFIRVDGKQITLGRFDDFDVAVETRKAAEKQYYGETNA